MKRVLLLRSNQIKSDSRVEKYIDYLRKKQIDYKVIGWDRLNSGIELPNTSFYRKKTGYVVGGIKAAINRIYWFIFLLKELKSQMDSNTIIHACDLDTAFPAALYKWIFNKKAFLLFDVFDWMSHMSAKTNPIILKSIKLMEKFTLKQSNKLYICEEERRVQIPNNEKYDIDVLPNIPMIENPQDVRIIKEDLKFHNELPTLSYVGYFSYGRFLNELIEIAEQKRINLLIAGYGNKELEDRCKSLAINNNNVKYFGKVEYIDGLKIMFNSDIIYAMYCKVEPNHYYAAPNKFYECMLLGRPIITTKGIIIGEKVEKLNIGYVIEEDINSLINLCDNISTDEIAKKSANAVKNWNSIYCNYTMNFMNTKYYKLLNSI